MNYQTFQQLRTRMRTRELEERAADIASPRPPLNNSITDQMIRDLYDRVEALETPSKVVKPDPAFAKVPAVFSLPSEKK